MADSDIPNKYNYRVSASELAYAVGPFSYEYIETRKNGQWRIRDINDCAVGRAENEEAAKFICEHLNKGGGL